MSRLYRFITRVLSFELFAVACAVAASVAVPRLLLPAVVVAVAFGLARWLRSSNASHLWLGVIDPSSDRALRPWTILLCVMLAVSFAVTAFPDLTWPQIWRMATGIALFYAVIHWVREAGELSQTNRLNTLVAGVMIVCILLSLMTPFVVEWPGGKQSFISSDVFARLPRLVSDGANPNVMAGALVILIPISVSHLLFTDKREAAPTGAIRGQRSILKGLSVASLVIAMSMLILSQSRSAYGAFVVAVAVLFALRFRFARLVLPACGLLIVGFLVMNPPVLSTLVDAALGGTTAGELERRIEIWSRALYMVQDFMFTGAGMGAFNEVATLLYPFVLAPADVPHAHNLFLQIAVDLGMPGLVAWLGILAYVVLSAWRAYRYGQGWLKALGAGLLASNVALCVHGLTDSVTWGMVRTAPLVWLLWGIAVAAGQVAIQQHKAHVSDEAQATQPVVHPSAAAVK